MLAVSYTGRYSVNIPVAIQHNKHRAGQEYPGRRVKNTGHIQENLASMQY